MNFVVLYVCVIACLIYCTYMLSLNYNVHDYEYVKKNGVLACMMSFLNRMQASDISNVCNQVLEEIV